MGTPGETSSEERSRSSLSNVLEPFCAARAAQVDNRVLDRSKNFWAFRELAQFAYPRWRLCEEAIGDLQTHLEAAGADAVDGYADTDFGRAAVADAMDRHANTVIDDFARLYSTLLVQFADGWNYDVDTKVANRVGYPASWLADVGYTDGTTYACKTTCP